MNKEAGDRRIDWRALLGIAAACCALVGSARVARAHDVNASFPGSCQVTNTSGRASMTVTVTNGSNESILNLTPSDLLGSASGSATFFVQTSPRPLRELLPGKSTNFGWTGRFYGDGLIDLSVQVTASFGDGSTETTGIVNCNRVAVGNPDGSEPATPTPAASDPPATNTAPASTPASSPTQSSQRPTRTPHVIPTGTPQLDPTGDPPAATPTGATRPTRTPILARSTRTPIGAQPTQTPGLPVDTPTSAGRPTRTPIAGRPTRTPISVLPTRTPALPAATPTRATRPTRTPISASAQPTRTPVGARPTRTPIVPTNTPTRAIPPTAMPTRQQPTRTPTLPLQAPTRTPIPARPTRTTIVAPTSRPTRTPLNDPPPPTATQAPNGTALQASCSLRRNGDVVSVTMIVENRSGGDLMNVSPTALLLEPEGGALFFDRTGPGPASVPVLHDGMSQAYQWGGRLSDGGTMGFSASVRANSASGPLITPAIDCGATGAETPTFDPTTFSGQCSIDAAANGQVTVMIRNASSETLTDIVASFVGKSQLGTGEALNVRGPSPHNVQTMASGVERDFTFDANFVGSGQVTMQFHATAVRSNGDGISTATISCTADVGVASGDLPDLTVRSEDLQNSIRLETDNFTAASCAVVEGCVDGLGARTLLRFDSVTPNLGPGDVFLGNPVGNPNFVWSDCHMHYHFEQYADYRLLDMSGNLVAHGHKQAFCLVDLWQPPGLNGRPHAQFTNCGFQGISAGWADVYNSGLDCQWIDVTGVPSGRYVLQVEINPAHVILENNYDNNIGTAEVTIP